MTAAKYIYLNGKEIRREEAEQIFGTRLFQHLEEEAYEDHLMDPLMTFPLYGKEGILAMTF